MVPFHDELIFRVLGAPNSLTCTFVELQAHLLYKAICHTLCGVDMTARWNRKRYDGTHCTLSMRKFMKKAHV